MTLRPTSIQTTRVPPGEADEPENYRVRMVVESVE